MGSQPARTATSGSPILPAIGSINPTTDAITEYAVPDTGTDAIAITAGPDGNVWFTDPGTNAIGVATLTTSQLVVTTQPPASVTAGSAFRADGRGREQLGQPDHLVQRHGNRGAGEQPRRRHPRRHPVRDGLGRLATFSGLTLNKAAAGYTLTSPAAALARASPSAITVTPAAPTQLVITTEPPAIVKLNGAFGLQASIEDQYGNVVTTDTNTVTVAFANNPTGATLSGTLSVAASQGVATFSGLEINKTGTGYTLQVTSSGLSSAVSSAIDVTKTGKAIIAPPSPTGTTAPDSLLAPLVFDSPGIPGLPGDSRNALAGPDRRSCRLAIEVSSSAGEASPFSVG